MYIYHSEDTLAPRGTQQSQGLDRGQQEDCVFRFTVVELILIMDVSVPLPINKAIGVDFQSANRVSTISTDILRNCDE